MHAETPAPGRTPSTGFFILSSTISLVRGPASPPYRFPFLPPTSIYLYRLPTGLYLHPAYRQDLVGGGVVPADWEDTLTHISGS